MKKILLVDDEERLRRLVRMTLGDDFNVIEAADGEDGVSLAEKEKPDLIFLDVMMPGIDGFSTCAAVKRNPSIRHIPVVMLTGRGEREDRKRGKEAGADDYFVKPFSPRDLLDKVYDIIGEPN